MTLAEYLEKHGLTQEAFAERMGVSQPRLSQWLKGETIPAERCRQIEELTNGEVTRRELRPALFE